MRDKDYTRIHVAQWWEGWGGWGGWGGRGSRAGA